MCTKIAIAALTALALTSTVSNAHVLGGYPAYAFDTSPISSDTQLSLGFTFTVTAPTLVSALGYWDQNGDGFLTPHEVGIFWGDGANGPGPLLAWTVLAAGESGFLDQFFSSKMGPSGFRYQRISGVWLEPGQQYTIAGLSPNVGVNDPWIYGGPTETTGFEVCPYACYAHISIGPNAARYTYGTPFLMDPSSHYSDYQFYAVNFLAAPEPATWAMMLAGFAGLGFLGYRRKNNDRAVAANH